LVRLEWLCEFTRPAANGSRFGSLRQGIENVKTLVTFAVEPEFAPWRRLHSFQRLSGFPFAVYETKFGNATLRVVLTGIGPAHARRVVAAALDWNPDVCISSGLAGSLRAVHRIGGIFAAREVMELESGRMLNSDANLLQRAESRGARVIDRLLSSKALVATADGKTRLGRMADAVDMESFAILAEAIARKIPAVAIRAISDAANESMPLDFSRTLDASGHVAGLKLALALAGAPHKLFGLARLGRNSRRAASALAEFLDSFVVDLPQQSFRPAEHVEAVRA
jgi:adenosylhomocysteine nucleosidase